VGGAARAAQGDWPGRKEVVRTQAR